MLKPATVEDLEFFIKNMGHRERFVFKSLVHTKTNDNLFLEVYSAIVGSGNVNITVTTVDAEGKPIVIGGKKRAKSKMLKKWKKINYTSLFDMIESPISGVVSETVLL